MRGRAGQGGLRPSGVRGAGGGSAGPGGFPALRRAARLGARRRLCALREAVPQSCVPALHSHAAIWSTREGDLFLEKHNFIFFFF